MGFYCDLGEFLKLHRVYVYVTPLFQKINSILQISLIFTIKK